MQGEDFIGREIEALQQCLHALRKNATVPGGPAGFEAAVHELTAALEEMHVSAEQRREQHEQLLGAAQAVDAERERYLELFELAPDGYLVTDTAGMIQEANTAAATLLRRRRNSLVGKPLAVFVAEDGLDAFHTQLNHLQAGTTDRLQDWEVCLRRHEGSRVDVALTVAAVHGPKGPVTGLRWLLRDITEHKRTVAALRESKVYTQAVVNTAVDGIITIDEQGIIQAFNPAAERLFEYAAGDVLGRNVKVLMPPPFRDAHDDFVATYLKTGVKRIIGIGREVVGQRKGGTTFPMDVAVSEVLVGGRRLFTGMVRDITERKRAERRLAVQYGVTRVLAESASLAEAGPRLLESVCQGLGWDLGEVWYVDAAAGVLRWDCLWHAPGLDSAEFQAVSREMTFPPGEALPGRVWESGQPVWRSDVATASPHFVRAALAAKVGLHGALAFPFRSGGAVTGVMMFFSRAITDPDPDLLEMLDALGTQIGDFMSRKRAEDGLRDSEHRFAEFMRHLPGVAFMKDADGRYVYVSEAFEKLFHHKCSEYIGKTDDDMWPLTTAVQLKENDRQVLGTGKTLQTTEIIPQDDGLHHWLSVKFPILNANGSPTMVGGVSIDVTERMRAENAVHDLQKLAQQRERLADIGAITAQIVHDLGNPLAGVSMQAQLILRRAMRDEKQPVSTIVQPVERIVTEVRRLDALIKEFMEFSREQRLELKPVHLPRFLGAVVELWQPLASAREIVLTLDVPDEVPALTGDEEKLHRVFENLVKNAVEAINQGPGYIRIGVRLRTPEQVRISVEDSGPGIPDTLDVFRLFETTKPNGSGLGLAIVRQIVLAHGGGIEYASRLPHGAIFHIDLPSRGPVG